MGISFCLMMLSRSRYDWSFLSRTTMSTYTLAGRVSQKASCSLSETVFASLGARQLLIGRLKQGPFFYSPTIAARKRTSTTLSSRTRSEDRAHLITHPHQCSLKRHILSNLSSSCRSSCGLARPRPRPRPRSLPLWPALPGASTPSSPKGSASSAPARAAWLCWLIAAARRLRFAAGALPATASTAYWWSVRSCVTGTCRLFLWVQKLKPVMLLQDNPLHIVD